MRPSASAVESTRKGDLAMKSMANSFRRGWFFSANPGISAPMTSRSSASVWMTCMTTLLRLGRRSDGTLRASYTRPASYLRTCCLLGLTALVSAAPATAQEPEPGERSFLEQPRRLIYEGRRSGEGYFSADGASMVFQSERLAENPFYQIYLLDLLTGDTRQVSTGVGKTTCAFFHPDGSEILFASTHHDPRSLELQREELEFRASGRERRYAWDYDPEMDLYAVANDPGATPRRLTEARGYDAEASYSPDGQWIVFTSTRDGYGRPLDDGERRRLEVDPAYFGEIWIMRADGSEPQRLTHTPGYDGGPFFFADGSRIVWRRFTDDGLQADLWSMRPDGTDPRRLTDFGSMSWAPYPHPSGEYVFFASNKHGFDNFEVFIVDADGTKEPVRVTYTDGFDGLPVPSPDGHRLAWTSNRHGEQGGQIYLADWNHDGALRALALAPDRDTVPATAPVSSTTRLEDHVSFLAGPELAGRLTGSVGELLASEYIAHQLARIGAHPLPGEDDMMFEFDFTAGARDVGSSVVVDGPLGAIEFTGADSVHALGFSDSGDVEGPAVFAGYGIRMPDSAEFGYDSYATLDVRDRIVVALRYVPEDTEGDVRATLNRYSGLRYKALTAREAGARGLLVVTGPRSPNAGKTIPMAFDTAAAGSGIPAASVGEEVALALFASTGRTLEEIQKSFDDGNPHAVGFEIPSVRIGLSTALERERRTGRNVVAALSGTAGTEASWVVLGAHYDHLGHGRGGSSLARGDEAGEVHPGADDNASGVAAVLEAARALSETDHRRPVAFAFWSGEELGVLGSSHFVDRGPIPTGRIAAYINLDMVGRVRDNRLNVQGIGSSPDWARVVEAANVPVGFDLSLQSDPYLPTDSAAFYNAGIPTANLFSGAHPDYHRPTDTAEKLDYEALGRVSRFAALLAARVAKRDGPLSFVQVERTMQRGGSRDTVRAYTGTVPDYASEVEGLLLSSVIEGGPAAAAGLRGGDMIVEFAGQAITSIYDYTYALDDVKVDVPVEVVFVRDGVRHRVMLTPGARP